jgi:agmatine/peptidylarginine deiminase
LEKNHLEDRVVSEFAPIGQPANASASLPAKGNRSGLIHIVPLAVDSYWVRDYGPVFGETKEGGLCVLDAIYRDVRAEGNDPWRLKDDQVPTVLATLLANRHRKESIHVVRPPLQLWGGDLFVDGQGNGFTSTNTLVMNGGVKEELNVLLRAYYGLKQVTYFEPLPGSTIKHIDMFFRPADERTFLVAQYPEDVATGIPVLDYMHKEARAILERNAQLLRTKFPNAEILRVPMPPLSFEKDRRDMLHASLDQLKQVVLDPADWLLQGQLEQKSLPGTFEDYAIEFACQYGLTDKRGRISSTRSAYMREQVVRWKGIGNEANDMLNDMIRLREKINALARNSPLTQSDRELLQKYQAEYKALQEEYALQTRYKTYLNSLHLKGASNEKVLVPSYRRFRNLEPVVREVYQRAYPRAEVVFIPADELSEQFGAIHCVTCVIPDLSSLSQKYSTK